MRDLRRGIGPAVGVAVAVVGSYVLWLGLVEVASWAATILF